MDTEKVFETLYDHYKESCSLTNSKLENRNKDFLLLCILEAVSFLIIWNPSITFGLLNDAIRSKIESSIQIGNNALQTLIWVLISFVLVRYIQDTLYVERQYKYLERLEISIKDIVGNSDFSRESEYYSSNYPPVLNLIHLFYTFFCPLFFTAINVYHIILEWQNSIMKVSLIFDTALFIFIFIITWSFFFGIHPRTKAWFLKCKLIRSLNTFFEKCLKEV